MSKEESSFEDTLRTIQENIRKTLDPQFWNIEGISDIELENNIKRNMIMVQALTFLDGLYINGQEVKGEAIKIDGSDVNIGPKAAYLVMGGRIIGEFHKNHASDLFSNLLGTDENGKLLVSKNFDNITDEESSKGIVATQRITSTHKIASDGKTEKRGVMTGLGTLARNTVLLSPQNIDSTLNGNGAFQVGVNMTSGGIGNKTMKIPGGKEMNFLGDPERAVDSSGSFGQMLLVLQTFKPMEKGTLMIGIEQSGYGSKPAISPEKHDLKGKSPDIGPMGTKKHRAFKATDYTSHNLIMPNLNEKGEPIGSMRSIITPEIQENALNAAKDYEKIAQKKLQLIKTQEQALSIKQSLTEFLMSDYTSSNNLGAETVLNVLTESGYASRRSSLSDSVETPSKNTSSSLLDSVATTLSENTSRSSSRVARRKNSKQNNLGPISTV